MVGNLSGLPIAGSRTRGSDGGRGNVLWLILLTSIARPAVALELPPAQINHALKIVLRVYNYAKVPRKTLASALQEAQHIFEKANVETDWLVCPIAASPEKPNSACDDEKPSGLLVIDVSVLPESMADRLDAHDEDVGFALSTSGGGGFEAGVFSDRVTKLAESRRIVDCRLLLAVVMAHEIGHLLLGRESHSPSGIMRATWDREEMALAGQGYLLFTPGQAEQLRRALAMKVHQP